MQNKIISKFFQCCKLLLFFVLEQLIAVSTFFIQQTAPGTISHTLLIISFFIGGMTVISWLSYCYYRQIKQNHHYQPHWLTRRDMVVVIIGIVLVLIAQNSITLLNHYLHLPIATQSANQQALLMLKHSALVIMVIYTVLFAPIMEELIFRGIFYNYFFTNAQGWRMVSGIIINGCLFGVLHEQTHLLIWLVYTLLGIILASSYQYTKNIYVSMTIHIINNLLSVVS
ncbi:MAG: CPBP family intramembrane metalloprotease [Candidatus Paralactobacillus gallistercoris]|uniref:CPBP family intramembrane metalloprotease n=1 Tax=Candidatus Paralactobacillus gallistercoris TaxID=2838724 RepID=A0A948TJF8_9LACO|nr:CPBP family intramembrane metalloprotease [Candidatus Paralactobacillus gallistercoris]